LNPWPILSSVRVVLNLQADSGVIRGLGLSMGLGGQAGDAVAMEDEQGNAADELNALAAGETLPLGPRS
jgi:hypothetical protein